MSQKLQSEMKSTQPNPSFPGVEDVTPEEVNQLRTSVRMIDVRRPDEWSGEFGHIPEAQHLILDALPMQISELDKEETIIFVCRSGNRSAQATQFAKENGFTDVFNMKGGMIAWTELQYEAAEKNGS